MIAANHKALLERESRVLLLAVAWADAHDLDPTRGDYQPLIERACAWGGEGTPQVSEYCAVELGALQGIGSVSARMLIADALDLRHRLPRLWAQVTAGQVRAWQARKVAEATRPLSWEAAREVDDAVSGFIGMLPWGRFQTVLTASILNADAALAAERELRARTTRDVWATDSEDGLKTVIARAASGDAVWLMATVNRLAEILAAQGDTDPVGARRSKAVGILAQPARAFALLAAHQHDPAPADLPAEPDDIGREPEPDELPEPAEAAELADQSSTFDFSAAWESGKVGRPKVVLHFHLSDHAVEVGHGLVRPSTGPSSPSSNCGRSWPTPAATSRSGPSSTPPPPHRSTRTRPPTGSAPP